VQSLAHEEATPMAIDKDHVRELVLQALETERGGIDVYENAIECASNDELRQEWEKYLDQTRNHERVMLELCEALDVDPEEETPGRAVVRHIGKSLVAAMEMARSSGDAGAAQLVATECVVLAETKDHLNWELLGELSEHERGERKRALESAVEEVEEDEDKHLYHTQGWGRELWLEALGLPAVIPPPEEEKDVTTAIGAARAKQQREEML
jgi:rubrerythrin